MIYPQNTVEIPVFAVEYIAFGSKPHVAVLDLQPTSGPNGLLGHHLVHNLTELSQSYRKQLTSGGELPEWALAHFTPVCLYSRPDSPGQAEVLIGAFIDFLKIWSSLYLPKESENLSDGESLQSYKQHHVDHTPGRPFLTKIFGEEWTERYLRQFMYA
jgi:hypothetical protein